MTILIHGRQFSVEPHEIPWGYLRSRTVLHVSVLGGMSTSHDTFAQFLNDHQERLGINCVPGNAPGRTWPVMVVTPHGTEALDELSVRLLRALENSL